MPFFTFILAMVFDQPEKEVKNTRLRLGQVKKYRKRKRMRFFVTLSIANVTILPADSPVAHTLSSYNPYSLLHIPLYAVLTILLVLSGFPSKGCSLSAIRSLGFIDTGSINVKRLFICALIAAAAVADEVTRPGP
jgi:hypothetical protein